MRLSKLVLIVAVLALVTAPAALSIAFTDASFSPPVGATGQSYYHQFQIRPGGGCPPYNYSILSGLFPPGLSLATQGKNAGDVTGTPTTAGQYSFWIDAYDTPAACGFPNTLPAHTQRQFTITIQQGLQIQQRQPVLTPAQMNTPYSLQFTASAGGATWTVSSGALPAGLSLSTGGLLSGTPTTPGDYSFKITAAAGGRSDTQTYSMSVVNKLQLTAAARPGEVGHAFTLTPQATGGKPGYTFAVEGTLPTGLQAATDTGAITGTPAAAGTYPLKLRVTDSLGLTTTLDVSLKVNAKLSIVKRALRAAKVGTLYRAKLTVLGGVGPYRWNILGGKPGFLPQGITLNKRTGTFAGTPTKAGVYRLRMQVVDKYHVKSAIGILLKVNA